MTLIPTHDLCAQCADALERCIWFRLDRDSGLLQPAKIDTHRGRAGGAARDQT